MKKKSNRSRLMSKLDRLWSEHIRKKFRRCVICGKTEYLSAHHCIVRKAQSLGVRWLPENGVSLCYSCHICKLHGQQADKEWLDKYIEKINEIVPMNKQNEIRKIGHNVNKLSIEELEEKIKWFNSYGKEK